MKSLFLRSLYLIFAFISFSIPATFCAQDLEGFNLSDDEKQKLDQELEQFVNIFNNLSPEEMQQLEELNKVLEDQMEAEGLDPSNIDDVIKWAEKQAQQELENQEPAVEEEIEPAAKEPIKSVEFKQISADSDASAMLLNLVTYISELRQKSISYDEMNKKLERFSSELNELSYFAHSLATPELMKHLLSKDFETLYKNLEAFYQILVKQVPLVQVKEIEETDIENQYQTLGLTNQSSMEQVEDAYQNLKEMFDIDKIKEQLQKQNIPDQEISKTIKQSKISFSFIQDAYDELKDPKQKAIVDRKISEEADNQKRLEKSSYRAFDEIYKVFTDKLFPILSDIKKLFEKHRPEEISKAKQYDDREKKLLAESKKPFKVIKGDTSRMKFPKDNEYDEFYKHLSQKDRNKTPSSYKPLFDDNYGSDFFGGDKGGSDKPSLDKSKGKDGGGDKKPAGKPEEKKKDDGKKDDKKDDKSKGAPAKKPADKEPELLGEIGILSKLLEDAAKSEGKIQAPRTAAAPTRSASGEEAAQPAFEIVKLKDIRKGLDTYLTTNPAVITQSTESTVLQQKDKQFLTDFIEFAKQNNIENIATGLKKLAPGASGKIESESVSKMLKDKVLKHKSLIDTWYTNFYPVLNPVSRRDANLNKIDINKQNAHRLGTTSSTKEDTDKATKLAQTARTQYPYIPDENLFKIREFLKGMYDSMATIQKALGAEQATPAPKA